MDLLGDVLGGEAVVEWRGAGHLHPAAAGDEDLRREVVIVIDHADV